MFDALKSKGYQIEFHSHAEAILGVDFPEAVGELEKALLEQSLPIEEIIGSGGGETKGTQRLRRNLTAVNWVKETFSIVKTINGETREAVSHKVDHVSAVELLLKSNGTIRTRSLIAISKISNRINRGVGNPCPLVLIGLPSSIVTFGEDPTVIANLLEKGAVAYEPEGI